MVNAKTLTLAIIFAFAPPLAGQTQINITEEYKGSINEIKPKGLLHPIYDTTSTGKPKGLTPEQVASLKQIITATDNISLRDGLENAIVLDLYQKENYAALLNEVQQYVTRYPQGDRNFRPQIVFYVAESFYYQGKYQDAMLNYRDIMNNYGGSEIYAFAQQGLAWCLMHLGRFEEARTEFSAATTYLLVVSAFFGKAITNFNDKRYAEAVEYFFDETEYQQIGLWGDPAKGGDLAEELVSKNLYYRGLSYDRLGDQRTAIIYFRRVADDYPASVKAGPATYLVGRLGFNVEDYNLAITYFNKALRLVSDSSSLYEINTNLAQAYYNSGRLSEAIDRWKKIRAGWGPQVANLGLEQAYTRLINEIMENPASTVETDSLERLLNDFATNIPASRDISYYQLELAKRFYTEADYRKTLEWAALASGGQANEDIIKEAKIYRMLSLYQLKEYEKLVAEGDNFQQNYPAALTCDLRFLLGAGHSYRGDELKTVNVQHAQDQYRKAITLLEQFLRDAPADHPYRQQAERLLAYCRSNFQ